ncbi:MAG: methionyl-tRNA formyltransferase [bacterium]
MNNIKTAYFGSSEFSVLVLGELKSRGWVPDLIVTTPDKPRGRKLVITPNETKVWAHENNIPVISPASIKTPEFLTEIQGYDLHLVASYGKIIPDDVLNAPKFGELNIHPSLLPKYRGSCPIQTAILNDDKETGLTIMKLDHDMDHGPIVAQEKINIPDWPISFNELAIRMSKLGAEMFLKVLPDWTSSVIKAVEQNHDQATYTKKIEKTDGEINLNDDARKNYLKILAYSDWPNTYFFVEAQGKKIRLIVKEAKLENDKLVLLRVIPEGKKEMSYEDFLRGIK